MDLNLISKLIINGEKYISFNSYCECFNKSPRVVRQSITSDKIFTKKINKKIYIKI